VTDPKEDRRVMLGDVERLWAECESACGTLPHGGTVRSAMCDAWRLGAERVERRLHEIEKLVDERGVEATGDLRAFIEDLQHAIAAAWCCGTGSGQHMDGCPWVRRAEPEEIPW
jgi:hypothetical protein